MKPPRFSTDKLAKQFTRGDRRALSEVYDMWFNHLVYFAYKITGDLAEAEDITITTLQILLSRHDQFGSMSNIKAFLYITVRNKCFKFLQSAERQKNCYKEFSMTQVEEEEYILRKMIRAELTNQLIKEIESLPAKRREVFKLFYIEGLNISEIAAKLEMTPGAVSTNKFKALEQIRTVVLDKKLLPTIGSFFLVLQQLLCKLESHLNNYC
jgi:RNA polymerase sigma factor (sigma-70 family)